MKNPTTFVGYASGIDKQGRTHQVTVVAIRKEIKDDCLTDLITTIDNNGHGKFYCEVQPDYTYTLDASYAISYPDDTIDMCLGKCIAERRVKNKEFRTVMLNSDKMIPAPICQAIVDAEAERIAAKMDSYIAKLQRV